jgi:predicted GNAT family N-acyltransferase
MERRRITEEYELKKAFRNRIKVLVEEQGLPLADELDQFDTLNGQCEHILIYYNGHPTWTGRLRIVDHYGKLEKICILEPYRKSGIGKVIIKALEEILEEKGVSQVKLHGQTHAEGFYKKLGDTTSSDVFMEDGIPIF